MRWDNAVVIFDEAHNVEGVCSDSSSFELSARQLTDAIAELKRYAASAAWAADLRIAALLFAPGHHITRGTAGPRRCA